LQEYSVNRFDLVPVGIKMKSFYMPTKTFGNTSINKTLDDLKASFDAIDFLQDSKTQRFSAKWISTLKKKIGEEDYNDRIKRIVAMGLFKGGIVDLRRVYSLLKELPRRSKEEKMYDDRSEYKKIWDKKYCTFSDGSNLEFVYRNIVENPKEYGFLRTYFDAPDEFSRTKVAAYIVVMTRHGNIITKHTSKYSQREWDKWDNYLQEVKEVTLPHPIYRKDNTLVTQKGDILFTMVV